MTFEHRKISSSSEHRNNTKKQNPCWSPKFSFRTTRRNNLSEHRNSLSEHRNNISEHRNNLSEHQNNLSEHRNNLLNNGLTFLNTEMTHLTTEITFLNTKMTHLNTEMTLIPGVSWSVDWWRRTGLSAAAWRRSCTKRSGSPWRMSSFRGKLNRFVSFYQLFLLCHFGFRYFFTVVSIQVFLLFFLKIWIL